MIEINPTGRTLSEHKHTQKNCLSLTLGIALHTDYTSANFKYVAWVLSELIFFTMEEYGGPTLDDRL